MWKEGREGEEKEEEIEEEKGEEREEENGEEKGEENRKGGQYLRFNYYTSPISSSLLFFYLSTVPFPISYQQAPSRVYHFPLKPIKTN